MDDFKNLDSFLNRSEFTQDQERQKNPVNNYSLKDSYLDTWELFTVPILRNSSWISNLASIATLLGLLGTVLGIQESFIAMQALGKTTLDIFAGGVSRALSTTILGLCIAIPSYLLNQLLKSELLQLTALFQIKLAKNLESDSKNQ
ncbi:MAG: MotA/TolQ/ExbB proton channel family protein [Leptospira sp.]|nr:MotA/TolQ/ExbB proton channel family protein [Leptospira sp.]